MKKREKKPVELMGLPTTKQLETELHHAKYKKTYSRLFRTTVFTLVVVAAFAILSATLWLPVLEIYGTSMNPTLKEGDLVVSLKGKKYKTGDVIAFYYNNKILVKRVIAQAGQWVNIDQDGNVYINDELIEEPYVEEKAYGESTISFPYQVPEGRLFVLGDHRSVSMDSRNAAIGCVSKDQIVGKLKFCIWPLADAKYLHKNS